MNHQQLRDDLNRIADERIRSYRELHLPVYVETSNGPGAHDDREMAAAMASIQKDDLIFQDDDRPGKHNVLASAAVLLPFCLLFFWGVWEAGKAIGQQAGIF